MKALRFTAATLLVAGILACGSSSSSSSNNNNNTNSAVANKTFQASLSNGGKLTVFFGPATALQLTPRSEFATTIVVQGTYTPNGGSPITLTGTYDPATGQFSLTGGGVSVSGLYVNGTISGTITPSGGSPISFSGTELTSDACNAFVNNVNAKAASCSLQANPLFLNACKAAEFGACTTADQAVLNNVATCAGNVPACTSQSTFSTALAPCVTNVTGLSSACNTALAAAAQGTLTLVSTSSGTSTFTSGGGSCNITVNSTLAACEEFASGTASTAVQAACQPATCSATYGGASASCAYQSSQCSSTNRLGRCLYTSAGISYQLSWYNVLGASASALQQACTAGATGGVTTQWFAN